MPSVPLDIDLPASCHGRIAAQAFRDHVALIDGGRRLTHAQFWQTAEQLARGLSQLGLEPGARVAMWLNNCVEYLQLSVALEIAGLVRVPLNARYTGTQVQAIIDDCTATLLFADEPRKRQLPCSTACIAIGTDQWQALFREGSSADLYQAIPTDLCSLNYTSGSTGEPKGVMLSHRNWAAVYRNLLCDRDIRADDRLLHVGPLSHASGAYFMPFFLRGATSIISAPRIGGMLRSLENEGVTVLTCVPSLLTRLLKDARLASIDLAKLRQIGYGGEPIAASSLQAAWAHFGPILVPNYGLTEAMMTVCFMPADELALSREPRQDVLGRPYQHVEVVLRDDLGHPVGEGEVGEVTVRGEHVMQGYWGRAAETAKVLRDGWLYSGDLARCDTDGIYRLAGRKKDMLICGGFNIYPQEVAAVVAQCPGVVEVAVLGLADPDWGEVPVAFVAGHGLQRKDLTAFTRPRLGIRSPKRWIICDSLPRNLAGKIDTQQLRAELQARDSDIHA